jgi:hypothetical protein
LRGQQTTPWARKSFIYERSGTFQAVGRGFDSRLPLQDFLRKHFRSDQAGIAQLVER